MTCHEILLYRWHQIYHARKLLRQNINSFSYQSPGDGDTWTDLSASRAIFYTLFPCWFKLLSCSTMYIFQAHTIMFITCIFLLYIVSLVVHHTWETRPKFLLQIFILLLISTWFTQTGRLIPMAPLISPNIYIHNMTGDV